LPFYRYPALCAEVNTSGACAGRAEVRGLPMDNEDRHHRELSEFLTIRHLPATRDIQKNAAHLVGMLERARIETHLLPISGRGPWFSAS